MADNFSSPSEWYFSLKVQGWTASPNLPCGYMSFICCQNKKKETHVPLQPWLVMSFLIHFSMVSPILIIDAEGMGVIGMEKPQGGRTWMSMWKSAVSPSSTPTQQRYLQSHSDMLGNYGSHTVMQHNLECRASSGSSSSNHQVLRMDTR